MENIQTVPEKSFVFFKLKMKDKVKRPFRFELEQLSNSSINVGCI
jgi:hypothetical protein